MGDEVSRPEGPTDGPEEGRAEAPAETPPAEPPAMSVDRQAAERIPDSLRFPLVLGIVCAVSAVALSGLYALVKAKMEQARKRKVLSAFESVLVGREAKLEAVRDDEGKLKHYVLSKGPSGEVVALVRPVKKKDSDVVAWYDFKDESGGQVAYAAQVECPDSYNAADPVQIVVVAGPRIERILGVRVVQSKETPGLGENIKERPSAVSIVGWIAGGERKQRVVLADGGAVVGVVKCPGGQWKPGDAVELTGPDGKSQTIPGENVFAVTQPPFTPAFLDQFTRLPAADAKLKRDGGRVDAITGATVTSRAVANGVADAVTLLREAAEAPSR